MRLNLIVVALAAVLSWLQFANGANCNTFSSQTSCDGVSGCYWTNSRCTCASNVSMDLVFTIDASGSIGASSFQVALQWVVQIIDSGVTRDSRVAFIRFATNSDLLLDLVQSERYSQSQLETFAADIVYTGGNTNTVAALEQLMAMFSAEGNPYASWVNILITDGNPNAADNDVCSRASRMKAMGITTIIIGVGNEWNPAKVDCLVDSQSDIIYVTSYSSGQLNTILPAVTQVTCPVTYNLIISEVQLDLVSSTEGSRFVEAYNPSTAVTLVDLDLDGIFEGKVTTDSSLTLPQASYLVLYDKGAPSMISCQDCQCSKNSNNLCTDAVYVGCCSSCSCYFGGSSMSNTNWHVSLTDYTNSQVVDSVAYDTSTWPQILKGYTYTLKYVGYDNQLGSNWQQSCNTRGTPGSYPITNCSWTCTDQQCQVNGATNAVCQGSGSSQKCDCNSNNYYFADRTCNTVPPPGDCYAYWIKNETTNSRYVNFEWGAAATDRDHKYALTYYTKSGSSDEVITSSRTKTVADYDYSRGVNALAGTVQTQIMGSDGIAAYSSSQYCYPVTMSPTAAPTFSPPYVYVSGDICSEDRCSCADKNPYNCTGPDIEKDFSADDTKTQYISVRRMPEGFTSVVAVLWEILYDANYTGVTNSTTNSTKTTKRRLASVNATNATNATTDIGVNPHSGVIYFNASEFEQKIGFIIAKQATVPGENKYKWFVLNLTTCNSSNLQHCSPAYPSVLRMRVDITGGGDSLHETKTQKEMPKWLWWLIGGLVIFAAILAVLGYRYWWKHKQTSSELLETEDQLEHALEENELGFGRDLGVGDVQFNPIATGVPGQTKAPELFGGELDKRSKDASNVRADVAVEKFAHREQFGQQQGMKRPNGGNDLSQPLLG